MQQSHTNFCPFLHNFRVDALSNPESVQQIVTVLNEFDILVKAWWSNNGVRILGAYVILRVLSLNGLVNLFGQCAVCEMNALKSRDVLRHEG